MKNLKLDSPQVQIIKCMFHDRCNGKCSDTFSSVAFVTDHNVKIGRPIDIVNIKEVNTAENHIIFICGNCKPYRVTSGLKIAIKPSVIYFFTNKSVPPPDFWLIQHRFSIC